MAKKRSKRRQWTRDDVRELRASAKQKTWRGRLHALGAARALAMFSLGISLDRAQQFQPPHSRHCCRGPRKSPGTGVILEAHTAAFRKLGPAVRRSTRSGSGCRRLARRSIEVERKRLQAGAAISDDAAIARWHIPLQQAHRRKPGTSERTAYNNPPAVCGSNRIDERRLPPARDPDRSPQPNALRLQRGEDAHFRVSRAPASSMRSIASVTSTLDARTISSRWPMSPKPVTSVAACTPCSRRTRQRGGSTDMWHRPPSPNARAPSRACRLRAMSSTQRLGQDQRITRAQPLCAVPPRDTRPLTAKPSDNGSSLCATTAQCACAGSLAPTSSGEISLGSSPNGTVAIAAQIAARRPWHRCRPAHGWRRSGRTRRVVDHGPEISTV